MSLSAESVQASSTAELPDEDAAYLLHSRLDIIAVLRDLARKRTLLNVHCAGSHDALVTPLLEVDSTGGEILFDASGSSKLNESLVRAPKLLFYTAQDNVKIRFSTGAARPVRRAEQVGFAVRLPESMLRLQRRDCYRIVAPVLQPIQCTVPMQVESNVRYIDTRVHDISLGGVSLLVEPGSMIAEAGRQFPNCRIVLPGTGNAMVTLETVFACDLRLLNDRTLVRMGCKFVRPTMPALSLIQRHMMRLERERITRD